MTTVQKNMFFVHNHQPSWVNSHHRPKELTQGHFSLFIWELPISVGAFQSFQWDKEQNSNKEPTLSCRPKPNPNPNPKPTNKSNNPKRRLSIYRNNPKDWTLNPLKKWLVTNVRKNNVKNWTLNPLKKISTKREQKVWLKIRL